jgi:hypothetical protein
VDLVDVLMVLGTQCVSLIGQNVVFLQEELMVILVWAITGGHMLDPLLATAIDTFLAVQELPS